MWRLFITLYVLIAVFVAGYEVLSEGFIFTYYEDELIEDFSRDIQGWLITFDYFIGHVSEQELPIIIDRFSRESNFPMEFLSHAKVIQQYPESISKFNESNLYFIDLDNSELLYAPANIQGFLKIGPVKSISTVEDIVRYQGYLHWILLTLIISLWHINLWRKLAKLEKKVVAFGDGDLTARASEEPGIRIGRLNQTFNNMAEKTHQLLQQNRQLIRAVSHELRAPISRLRCQADLLDSESTRSQNAVYLNDMSEDITELEDLVDEILGYSRLEASGSIDSKILKQNIKPVLLELLNTMNREFNRDIPLACDTDVCAKIDVVHFRRAIGNLVQNAALYGVDTVEVCVEVDKEHASILVHVDDDGPGISAEERDRIFEPFARLDESRTRESGGYGLGLAIVKQIAHLHGGSIRVSTSSFGGARFSLEIPDCSNKQPTH